MNLNEEYNTVTILGSLNFTSFTSAKDKDSTILHKIIKDVLSLIQFMYYLSFYKSNTEISLLNNFSKS